MKKPTSFMIISLLLVCTIAINLAGCSVQAQAQDLMEGITPNAVTPMEDLTYQNAVVTDFAVRLFQTSEKAGENTLISPLSVLCALAMTANGAEDETLQQMQTVLGMSVEDLNLYLYSYVHHLPQGEKYKLRLANSIWFTDHDRFTVNQDFLQTNADYFAADIYKAPFNKQTCKDINHWVSENTDEMIPQILDKIPDAAVMYLVNALAFEAQWSTVYEEDQVKDGTFTKEDGTQQDVTLMYGSEHIYLEDENATGFMKMYQGGKYAFVAMLPNEGVSICDYVASLDGAALNAMLSNPQNTKVYTAIPKFEAEYDVEMSDILKDMGMPKAFVPEEAELAGIGTSTRGNIYISRVLHKTFLSVGEKGTKAGAATVVETNDMCADSGNRKEVYLDRPFVYLLIDCENHIPFFIGTQLEC